MAQTNPVRYANMDLLRYLMAFSVVIAHFGELTGHPLYWPISSGTAVSVFFGLSGFLVYASYLHHPDLKRYVWGRVRRIVPAYSLIVLGFAVGLVLVSSWSAKAYFFSASFWRYVGSNLLFLNFLQPTLPGVFESNPLPYVNGSLWTLKVEWFLYLTIPLFFWYVHRFRRNIPQVIAVLYTLSMAYVFLMDTWYAHTGNEAIHSLSHQFLGQLTYFYSGVLCYHYLDKISANRLRWALIALILIWFDLTSPAACVLLAVILSTAPVLWEKQKYLPNFSYEMYLIHFPVIQLAVCTGLSSTLPIWGCFLIVNLLILLGAYLTYRFARLF